MTRTDQTRKLPHLDRRLIAVVCLTVVPVIILSIVLSSVTMRQAQRREEASLRQSFDRFGQSMQAEETAILNWYQNFQAGHQTMLLADYGRNMVEAIAGVNSSADLFRTYDIRGYFWLQETFDEGRSFIRTSQGDYSEREVSLLRESLEKRAEEGNLPFGEWRIAAVQEGEECLPVLCLDFHYQNFNTSIGIDLTEELSRWAGSDGARNTAAILTDGGGTSAVSDGTGIRIIENGEEWNSASFVLADTIEDPGTGLTLELYAGKGKFPVSPAYVLLQILAWASLVLLFILWKVIRKESILPIQVLSEAMQQLDQSAYSRGAAGGTKENRAPVHIEEKPSTKEYSYLYQEFNRMSEDLDRARRQEQELYDTQMTNLRLQVNPHLLLNSLTMIYSLAQTGQDGLVQKFTMLLVRYFRYCLREDRQLVPLRDEMQFVEDYIEIQKIRYPGKFSAVYMMDESLEDILIPPLLVQNFVENATKYARTPDRTIEILINIREEEGQLLITVTDTGKGIRPDILEKLRNGEIYVDRDKRKHIGIWNCRRRLENLYGKESTEITLTSGESGTQVYISLPAERRADESSDCR